MSVTTSAPTREQMIEALAAIVAAADTFHSLHEADSQAGEFFSELAYRLQDEFFGREHVEDDSWHKDPIEVEIHARSSELEAEALSRVTPFEKRIQTLRAMAGRYRNAGTIDVGFELIIRCASCGEIEDGAAKGWRAVRRPHPEHSFEQTVLLCTECSEAESDGLVDLRPEAADA